MECLAIGPSNVAGQAFQWAEACISHLGIQAFSFSGSRAAARRIDGPAHKRSLHHRVRPTLVKELGAKLLLRKATYLLDESFTTITGDQRTENLRRDLAWLHERGTTVGTVFHGSDIRSPGLHLSREPASFFRLMSDTEVAKWEESTASRRRFALESGLPLFVSTPDLLLDLPDASWLPLVVDAQAWRTHTPPFSAAQLRVLHVPSRRLPAIKGTSCIDPVMNRLALNGMVEYLSPESLPHDQMPEIVGSVDIVIDQILTGSYGVAAIEAMAAGRLVIGNVGREVRAKIEGHVPIVDCSPAGLEDLILAIAADPGTYSSIAAEGPAFVAEYHSGVMSAAVLRRWLSPRAGE